MWGLSKPLFAEDTVTSGSRSAGFTLVELLVVVLILGILIAVALPRFMASSEDAKQSALDRDLTILQNAIDLYAVEHDDTYPGTISNVTSWANFVTQMTIQTTKSGDPGKDHGPYLRTGIPPNPFNGVRAGLIKGDISGAKAYGWEYDPKTGTIEAAHEGVEAPEPKGF